MSTNTSIDFNNGYLQCLADIATYMKEVKDGGSPATPKEITENFILPKIKEHQKNINIIMDEMFKAYHENK